MLAALRSPSRVFAAAAAGGSAFLASQGVRADCHCQVPCGIFDDPVRVATIREDAATVRKAMLQIASLTPKICKDPEAVNQAARWVATKEQAAANIITVASEYMLCQRVKRELFASQEEYLQALELHHILMQAAMKAKQTTNTAACDKLEHAIEDVGAMYTKK